MPSVGGRSPAAEARAEAERERIRAELAPVFAELKQIEKQKEQVTADAIERWRSKERRQTDTQRPATLVDIVSAGAVVEIDGDPEGHQVTVPILGELPRDASDELLSDRVLVGFADGGWAAVVDVFGLEDV